MTRHRHWANWLVVAIGLGCLARVVSYGLDPEIYGDDAYLMNNVLARPYLDLLGPLANGQVAPPGFLWVSKWVISQGRSDWAARLIPFLAGMAAVALFYLVARSVLTPAGSRLATALFAASHATIIYSVRAKPYAVDLFLALAVLALLLRWLRDPARCRPIVWLALLAPFAFWLSYPSMFMVAGSWIVVLLYAWRHRLRIPASCWTAWAALGISAIVSAALLYHLNIRRCLTEAEAVGLNRTWAIAFPPRKPLELLGWLITTHTGRMYAYPLGEKAFGSVLPFVFWVAGIVAMHRRRKGWLLAALLAPQLLLLTAAMLRLFPYGGHPRVSLFLAPSICLLIAAGVLEVAGWLRTRMRAVLMATIVILLVAVPVGEMVGAIVQRFQERPQTSIKRALVELIRTRRPQDVFVRPQEPAPLGGGGFSRQIYEYYMQLLPCPTPLNAAVPATLAPDSRVIVIGFQESSPATQQSEPSSTGWSELLAGLELRHKQIVTPTPTLGSLLILEYGPKRRPRPTGLTEPGSDWLPSGLQVAEATCRGSFRFLRPHRSGRVESMADSHADSQHDLQVLIEVARRMAETFELAPLLHTIIAASRDALDCDRATIFLYDDKRDELFSTVATGTGEIRFSAKLGIAGETARTKGIVHVPDAYNDERFNREIDRRTGYLTRNLLSLPLLVPGGEVIGVLQAINKLRGDFTPADILVAGALGALTGIALKRQMLLDEAAAKQRLERDLNIARDIQQQLLPEKDPQVAGYDLSGWNKPAEQTGGDLFDFLQRGERVGFMIADATGHGIGPALIVAQFRSLMRAIIDTGTVDLVEGAQRINRLLYEDLPDDRFVTSCFGRLDAAAHQIEYTSAGQGPILVCRAATGKMEHFDATSLPMGIMRDADVDTAKPIPLEPGDIFVLLTDGFIEWSNPTGELYGEDRLGAVVHNNRSQNCRALIQTIYQDVLRFAAGTPQLDDLTAILIKRL